MNFLPSCILITILVLPICTVISGESANLKKKIPKKGDKLIIDDLEDGSGFANPDGRNEMVYSGSGYGPDDEDAVDEHMEHSELPNTNVKSKKFPDSHIDKNEQTLPMPTVKSTVSPTTTIKVDLPVIEVNTKHDTKVNEKRPEEHDVTSMDKSPREESVNNVYVVNTSDRDRTTSFFAQPGILAAVIGGAVVGLLCAILVVMFIVYRMRKKDEGSYPLEEMKRCPTTNPYIKPNHREFFA